MRSTPDELQERTESRERSLNELFVGEEHRDALARLLQVVSSVAAGDDKIPRVVMLRGHSGVGKSRIIRELYETLRAGQGYWESLPGSSGTDGMASTDPIPSRKELTPPLHGLRWKPQELPSFGWWAFACHAKTADGGFVNPVEQVRAQLAAHALPLALARQERVGLPHRIKASWWTVVEEVREAALDEISDKALEILSENGIGIPFTPTLTRIVRGASKAIRLRRENARALEEDVDLTAQIHVQWESAAEELAGVIRGLTGPGFPTIVVVEDIHLMDEAFGSLLAELARPRKGNPVVVVGTAWPEAYGNPAFASWRDSLKREALLEEHDISGLGNQLNKLVLEVAPETDAHDAKLIADRFGNPLFLRLWLSLDEIQDQLDESPRLVVDEQMLANLPKSIHDVLERRWWELPEETRRALALASVAVVGSGGAAREFLVEVVKELGPYVGLTRDMVAEGLAGAVDPIAWCQSTNAPELIAFREALLQELVWTMTQRRPLSAVVRARGEVTQTASASLRRLLNERMAETWLLDHTDPVVLTAARWFTSMSPEHRSREAAAARWVLAQNEAAEYRFADALRHGVGALDSTSGVPDVPEEMPYLMRYSMVEWSASCGDLAGAARIAHEMVLEREAAVGSCHRHTLVARAIHADMLGEAENYDQAVAANRAVLADMERVFGRGHREVRVTRASLANWLGHMGDQVAAIAELRTLLAEQTADIGGSHPDALGTRLSLAAWLRESGEADLAVEEFSVVVHGFDSVLGPMDPRTLEARYGYGESLRRADRVEEAVKVLSDVRTGREAVLGADHPDTLFARNTLAGCVALSGQVARAVEEFESLAVDAHRALGELHPKTRIIVENLEHFRAVHAG